MRRYTTLAFASLIAALGVAVVASGCGEARALENFELGQHDHILAEAAGCKVECKSLGGYRRTCAIWDPGCKAVCMEVPECNAPGRVGGPPRICAIMRKAR